MQSSLFEIDKKLIGGSLLKNGVQRRKTKDEIVQNLSNNRILKAWL